ncbi:hypothetical protein AQ436_07885 [Arthrobacter sp. EpRS66]|nr:hypothetical protein AQ436_07885 [Arthrobacter sp. EpRS66]
MRALRQTDDQRDKAVAAEVAGNGIAAISAGICAVRQALKAVRERQKQLSSIQSRINMIRMNNLAIS